MVFRLRGERNCADAARAHKRVDTKVSTLLRITHFLRGHGADCRHVTAAKQGNGRGVFLPQRRTACAHVSAYSQCRIPFCYTGGQFSAGRGITVPRNSWARYNARHLRIRRLVQFIFVETVRNNALTNRAALLSPRGPSLALWAIHLVPHPA